MQNRTANPSNPQSLSNGAGLPRKNSMLLQDFTNSYMMVQNLKDVTCKSRSASNQNSRKLVYLFRIAAHTMIPRFIAIPLENPLTPHHEIFIVRFRLFRFIRFFKFLCPQHRFWQRSSSWRARATSSFAWRSTQSEASDESEIYF